MFYLTAVLQIIKRKIRLKSAVLKLKLCLEVIPTAGGRFYCASTILAVLRIHGLSWQHFLLKKTNPKSDRKMALLFFSLQVLKHNQIQHFWSLAFKHYWSHLLPLMFCWFQNISLLYSHFNLKQSTLHLNSRHLSQSCYIDK